MTFAVGNIVRKNPQYDAKDTTTYCVLEVGDVYGTALVKVDDPNASGWWEHQFFVLAEDVKNDPRTAKALLAKEAPPDEQAPPTVAPDVLVTLDEKLTLAAAAVIHNDAEAIELISSALADVRRAREA